MAHVAHPLTPADLIRDADEDAAELFRQFGSIVPVYLAYLASGERHAVGVPALFESPATKALVNPVLRETFARSSLPHVGGVLIVEAWLAEMPRYVGAIYARDPVGAAAEIRAVPPTSEHPQRREVVLYAAEILSPDRRVVLQALGCREIDRVTRGLADLVVNTMPAPEAAKLGFNQLGFGIVQPLQPTGGA